MSDKKLIPDLSPKMQMQCHRVSQKACDTVFKLIYEMFKTEDQTRQTKKQ